MGGVLDGWGVGWVGCWMGGVWDGWGVGWVGEKSVVYLSC